LKVVAREVVDANGDLKTAPVVGTGPWILDNFVLGQNFTARRNPDYFLKGMPYADSFQAFQTNDASAPSNAFRANTVNVVGVGYVPQPGEELLKAVPSAKALWTRLDRSPHHLVLNVTREPFNDIRVRQAISKGLDRKAIIDTIHVGHAVLSSGLLLPD